MVGLAFTPEQFKALLKMVYIANTVVNGHREEEYLKEYDELEQYVFSRASVAGFPAATWSHKAPHIDLAEDADPPQVDPEEHHHPSRLFENDAELNSLMDEYDRMVVTNMLSETLAERDIERKHGPAAKKSMTPKEYDELLECYTEAYADEFRTCGFDRLVVAREVAVPDETSTAAHAQEK